MSEQMADDLTARAERFLVQCGPCDGGLPMSCACPTDDPRPVIAALLDRVQAVEALRDAYYAWDGDPESEFSSSPRQRAQLDAALATPPTTDRAADGALGEGEEG